MSGLIADYAKSLEQAWAHTSVWAGLNSSCVDWWNNLITQVSHRQDILRVQELFLLHIGGTATEVPDAIRFVKEKSGFLFIFSQTSYLAANRVRQISPKDRTELPGIHNPIPSIHLAQQDEGKGEVKDLCFGHDKWNLYVPPVVQPEAPSIFLVALLTLQARTRRTVSYLMTQQSACSLRN